MDLTACTARQFGSSVQFMVVYQCNVSQANMTAFFVDGSTLSNLQVRHTVCHAMWGMRFSCRQRDDMRVVQYACCHVSCEVGTNELPYLFARPRASVHPTFLLELLQWSPKFSCMSTRSCHYHAMECATCQCKYLLIQASVCTYLFMPLFTS